MGTAMGDVSESVSWPIAPTHRLPKPPWQSEHSLSKLPYFGWLETDSSPPRIRSRQNEVSAAWTACGGQLHAMSREACVFRHGYALRRLPCRSAPQTNGSELRRMSYGEGVEHHPAASEGARQPVPARRRTCRSELRRLPQGRSRRAVPGAVDSVLLVPPEHVSAGDSTKPHCQRILDGMRAMPHDQHLAGRQV